MRPLFRVAGILLRSPLGLLSLLTYLLYVVDNARWQRPGRAGADRGAVE